VTTGFHVGVNYWPAATAMRFWRRFDADQVSRDFALVRGAGGDCVRLFLLWEDFQPAPNVVSEEMLVRLRTVADIARERGVSIIPTLFTGHMSGANFIPEWALDGSAARGRFRVLARDRVVERDTRNWYADDRIRSAQALLAREAARALAGHDALWGWDLGNENSNCCVPPTRDAGVRWLDTMASAIRAVDSSCHITLGMHLEDLEEDRNIGPREAAQVCDVLSAHGYPIYASWSGGATDDRLVEFIAHVTSWLGGKDVLFAEFGAPTRGDDPEAARTAAVLNEGEAAEYTARAFARLHASGTRGGLVWCFADYDRSIWADPPLDRAPHERHFGLWRADGSAKPAARALADWGGRDRVPRASPTWLAREDPASFYDAPRETLIRLYAASRGEPEVARPLL
jgi:endo-1,4-beta-mannosidase